MSKEAMKQWLKSLQWAMHIYQGVSPPHLIESVLSLEKAIAEAEKQEQGEPVAQHRDLHSHMMVVAHRAADAVTNNGQKFASKKEFVRAICIAIQSDKSLISKLTPPPQQRKPLTDETRNWIVATCPTPRHIIDAVERMHGIKE